MAAGTPLTRLTLGAVSVTDDLGYVALSDLARALGDIAADCRVIGGHMVTVLAARWREPVSGFEPLACRLQEARPSARSARPARIPQAGAAMALISPGSIRKPVHEPVHGLTWRPPDANYRASPYSARVPA